MFRSPTRYVCTLSSADYYSARQPFVWNRRRMVHSRGSCRSKCSTNEVGCYTFGKLPVNAATHERLPASTWFRGTRNDVAVHVLASTLTPGKSYFIFLEFMREQMSHVWTGLPPFRLSAAPLK